MNRIDLCLFAGQSNMAGRGITSDKWPMKAPSLLAGAGYEFRAVSDPTRLYPIEEPFGINENKVDGIYDVFDGGIPAKTGSMVTSFCNSYFQETLVPVVGVSASKGGSRISQWQMKSKEGYLTDALNRYQAAEKYLTEHGYQIRHRFMLWCQGESDGDIGTGRLEYERLFNQFWGTMKKVGLEKCFIIQIGYCKLPEADSSGQKKLDRQYQNIHNALEEIALFQSDAAIVSRAFVDMRKRGYMKDRFHYYQQGYNICGAEAGRTVAAEIMSMT